MDIYSCAMAVDMGHYAASLLGMYAAITAHGGPNFCGAMIPVPTNLDLRELASICHTEEDAVTLL